MSTRAMVHFVYTDSPTKIVANIYRHSDGYPEGMVPDLRRFFADVKAQTKDTRFNNPEYLAAKFIVWQAGQYTDKTEWHEQKNPLDFLGLGVAMVDHSDVEYIYTVHCGQSGDPVITCKTPDGETVDISELLKDEVPVTDTTLDNFVTLVDALVKPVKKQRETKYWKTTMYGNMVLVIRNRAGHYAVTGNIVKKWRPSTRAQLQSSDVPITKEEAEKILGIKL